MVPTHDANAADATMPGRTPRPARDAWLWGLLALLAGLALTAALAQREWHRAAQQRQQAFDAQLSAVEAALHGRLRAYELAVRAMQSLYLASDDVTDAEFHTAFRNLDVERHLPGLQGLSFAERRVTSDGEHYLVRRVLPEDGGNARFLGFDVATQPASMAAVERSRDLDSVVISAPFRLLQAPPGASSASGMAIRLPVYASGPPPATLAERRARMRGSIGAAFMIPVLIDSALRDFTPHALDIAIRDATGDAPVLLYQGGGHAAPGALRGRREFRFGERTWRIDLADTAVAPGGGWSPWVVTALSGGLSSLLLGALAWTVIGARRRAIELAQAVEARYRSSEARFRRLNEMLPTLVLLVDQPTGLVTYANKIARERLGIGKSGAALAALSPQPLQETLGQVAPDQRWAGEMPLAGIDGEFWASLLASSIQLDGHANWLMVATDISEQRRLTEHLSYQASHDALTRLPNRTAFEAAIKDALASPDGQTYCLLFIDLDQFKLINDTSGHIAGDRMLVQLAMQMRQQLRKPDLLARLGGDEFGVLLGGIGSPAAASIAAERLRAAIDRHVFLWEQRSYTISASIGGVVFRSGSSTLNELLARADTACYAAKDAGRNRVHFYAEGEAAAVIRRSEMDWAHRIRWALDESRLQLAYQELRPIAHWEMSSRHIELLLRLLDEQGEPILPAAFLPAAERYGLMPRIDRWVVDTALANLDRLHPSGAALERVAINLSGGSLQEEEFGDYLLQAMERHRVDPRRLMFEITETSAVRDLMQANALVERLRSSGCRVALDDFGTGMSSFGYLKHLAVDTLKVDGAFVADIDRDAVSHSIVRAIAEIGHQHGLDVVAEWVASAAHVQVLAQLGVDAVQGFGIHRPETVVFQR